MFAFYLKLSHEKGIVMIDFETGNSIVNFFIDLLF